MAGSGEVLLVFGILAALGGVPASWGLAKVPGYTIGMALGWVLASAILGPILEEMLNRGYWFQNIRRGWGVIPAILATSLLFGGLHLLNPNAAILGAMNIALSAAAYALGMLWLRSLWFPIGWHAAWNFAQFLIILFSGQPYFALELVPGIVAELSIMALNLLLPVFVLLRQSQRPVQPVSSALAWYWMGWKTIGWGAFGLAAALVLAEVINLLIGSLPFPYGGGLGRPLVFPQDSGLLLLLLALWIVTTLGEEIMFRGFLQGQFSQLYGPLSGLLLATLLFALRHLPADLYWGWGASTGEWASRLLQLAAVSLTFGWIRHRSGSTASTWVAHLLLWLAVIVIN